MAAGVQDIDLVEDLRVVGQFWPEEADALKPCTFTIDRTTYMGRKAQCDRVEQLIGEIGRAVGDPGKLRKDLDEALKAMERISK